MTAQEILEGKGELYLGDGLYVRFVGFQFILRAPREKGDHFVGLDFSMLKSLNEFAERCKQK